MDFGTYIGALSEGVRRARRDGWCPEKREGGPPARFVREGDERRMLAHDLAVEYGVIVEEEVG